MTLPFPSTLRTVLLVALASLAFGQEPVQDARTVLHNVVENLRGVSQWATLELTVERPGRTNEYRLEIVTDGDQRSLARVVAPAREAGQAFLSIGSNLLIYNPRLGRSLRLPPSGRSNAFLGSDLSYDDLAGEEYREQYDAVVTAHDADAIVLELTPHPEAPTPYGKLVFTVQPQSYAPLSLTSYDQRDTPVRRMTFSEFDSVDGRTIPLRFEVVDLLKDGYRTVASWTEVDTTTPVPDGCFTEAALERGCRAP